MATDDNLDATSRKILNEIEEMRRLELEKRQTARSSDEFHDLAEKVEEKSRHIFAHAKEELRQGRDDSPIQAERDEQHPGDWAEGRRT
jgi:hypothetical protein